MPNVTPEVPRGQPMTTAGLSLSSARVRGLVAAAIFFSVFSNLLMLTGPLFMLQIYDRVLISRSEETLVALFGLVAVLYVFYWLLEFARGRVMGRVASRVYSALNARVFRAGLDRAVAGKSGTAALHDLEAVRTFLGSPVLLAMFDMPWTAAFLAAIFLFHPWLGWLAMAGGGLLIVIALLNQRLTARRAAGAHRLSLEALSFARNAETGSELIAAQSMGPAMTRRWSAIQDAYLADAARTGDWTGAFTSFTRAFRFFLQSALLALGAWLVLRGEITAGAMIAASILLGRALAPIETGVSQWNLVQRARSGWRNLASLLAETPAPAVPTELPAPRPRLEVRGVSVAPQRGHPPVLSQITFSLKEGQALGVIGRSGAGKSTLARVITGLLRPQVGEVRLDGATLPQYGADRLGRYIGVLPQDVRFFDGTIAENIAHMADTPDPEKVVAAARKAHIHDIVLKLPHGYDTRIGASDACLSGGQKQRLALARALHGDPVLLVLDEPNSALDAEGSEALNAAVNEAKNDGRAVIIMTHRPTAISTCDSLLVLDGGRVTAYGPRDEVVRKMLKNAGDVQRVVGKGQAS